MPNLSSHHDDRLARARIALDGLSVGDAFGDRFFNSASLDWHPGNLPPGPWGYSDDTEMALGIYDCLSRHRRIDQDALATIFARRYHFEPDRGYGGTIRGILDGIYHGISWQSLAPAVFGGGGSMGNGAAMRVAPLGAYYADDPELLIREAVHSAQVTHAHADGQAGAVAVAIASAWAWTAAPRTPEDLFATVLAGTPAGPTREGIERARDLGEVRHIRSATSALGNGSQVVSSDTVPFCLWVVARYLGEPAVDFAGALWTTATAEGDRDTTSAIVGGILAGLDGGRAIPAEWLEEREVLGFNADLYPPQRITAAVWELRRGGRG